METRLNDKLTEEREETQRKRERETGRKGQREKGTEVTERQREII